MEHELGGTTRRKFLAAGGLGAALALGLPLRAEAQEMTDVEKANAKVVSDFCAAWTTRDVDKIGAFLAEDAVFRMMETAPRTEGREKIMQALRMFLTNATSAEFIVHKSHVVGNIVLNQRTDVFKRSNQPDMSFNVSGVFFVKDGKIAEWYDFMMPQ